LEANLCRKSLSCGGYQEEEEEEEEEMQLSFRKKIKYTQGLEVIEISN
jgi:hypothetical protein